MSTALTLPLPAQSVGNLNQLIRAAQQAPYLSADEEHALAVRLHDEGDIDAARQLVNSHLRYVIHVARGYNGYGLPQAYLIQEGISLIWPSKPDGPKASVSCWRSFFMNV